MFPKCFRDSSLVTLRHVSSLRLMTWSRDCHEAVLSLVTSARYDPAARPDTGDTGPGPEISSSFYL